MGPVFYNDNDSYAAAWLGNLTAAGHLPPGTIDDRSILDLDPADLRPFRQCHFFAGIGGWPLALALAGWPADRPVWTGSCPCQPFSSAGKQGGGADERHLWPLWFRLIEVCRPDAIFGEQVAGAVGFGWIDRVFADLEALGYACGAAVLGAHSLGAPHIRQRLFWVADRGMAHSEPARPWSASHQTVCGRQPSAGWSGATGGLADADQQRQREAGSASTGTWTSGSGATGGLGDASGPGLEGRLREWPDAERENQHRHAGRDGNTDNFWSDFVWLPCLDGKARRTQPGIFPLAHGISNRVGRLRAYGNAITPQAAATFISAFLDSNLKG